MRFRWSWKVSLICACFIALFLRLSYWQWQRHQFKVGYIAAMHERLGEPSAPLIDLVATAANNWGSTSYWDSATYRRVQVSGTFDFEHEMLLRNRKYKEAMGVHALTPLKIDGTEIYVLVDRGFIPLSKSKPSTRKTYQNPAHIQFIGLIKANVERRLFAPRDPIAGPDKPWVDQWLRVDSEAMSSQLPYKLLPIFLEIMKTEDREAVEQQIVDTSASGRDEMFFMTGNKNLMGVASDDVGQGNYPLPVFNTVIPPGRHLGYVYEWAILAGIVLLMGLILQMRRPQGSAQTVADAH